MDIKQDHTKRINNVILYIENNLSDDLSVEILAKLACFSKFHFSRIFKSITGESVYHYIKRLRLERASYYLWSSDKSIKDIARNCGFNTTSNFSYNFRQYYGVSAKEIKVRNRRSISDEEAPDIPVEIKDLPAMRLGYIKRIGNKGINMKDDIKTLYHWTVAGGECPRMLVYMEYDSIYVTKKEHLRTDICVPVSENIKANDNISIMSVPKIKVISTKVENFNNYQIAMDNLDEWILYSGYQTIIGVPTVVLRKNVVFNNSGELDESSIYTEICIPVKVK